jgi:outer membrane receptor protein involved in Fe transport
VRFIILMLLSLLSLSASARATARIEGKILEAGSGKPLPYANVVITGTAKGAMSQADGGFVITPLDPGSYELQVSFVGYETIKQTVRVEEGQTLNVTFRLKGTAVRTKEVTIKADRPLVDVKRASTIRTYDAEEMKRFAIQPTLDSVVEQQPGVTKDNDQIHIRGGRADETLYIVDGVRQRDLLSGESKGSTIGAKSVAEVNIITGGFDAKYGQALSGIIEAKLKEGTDQFHGYFGYSTDRWVDDKNVDIFDFQISGPLQLMPRVARLFGAEDGGKMKFFFNIAADLSDGWLPSISDLPGDKKLRSSYKDHVFGDGFRYGSFFYPRANDNWRLLFKTSWRATPSDKFDLSFTKSIGFDQGFGQAEIADINRNETNYPWNWSQRLDHYYTDSQDQNSFSLAWNKGVSRDLVSSLVFTRYFTSTHRDVDAMMWTEYDPRTDTDVPEENASPYFVDVGDAPDYRDRFVETLGLANDWSYTRDRHKFDWGIQHQYENVQYLTLTATTIDLPEKPLGDEFDLFHVHPSSGALYVQDRLEYESLVAGLGLRYDYWFPGKEVEELYDNWEERNRPTINEGTRQEFLNDTHELFGHPFKGHLSPRLQISHPITTHDNLFFNYGHFTQRPAYFYVYAKSGSQSSEEFPRIGNPNLNPEISVQYEVGGGHQFRPDFAGKLSLFYKDIYDYPTSTTLVLKERRTSRSNFFIYRNLDYARSTGFEVELRKRRTSHWGGAVAYTYSGAKGKSSDPNNLKLVQESGGDARETELGEVYMWWNRPHKFTIWYSFASPHGDQLRLAGHAIPDDWDFSVYTLVQSGRAYTPTNEFGDKTGQDYSKNGPFEATTNVKFRKGFRPFGFNMEGTLEIFNLFNRRTALSVDPATGQLWKPGEGSLNSPYEDPANLALSDEELIEEAGATVGPDQSVEEVAAGIRSSITATVDRYSNPSYRAAPRTVRIGVGVEW